MQCPTNTMRLFVEFLHPGVYGVQFLFALLSARHLALLHDLRSADVAAEFELSSTGRQGDKRGNVKLIELFLATWTQIVVLVDFLFPTMQSVRQLIKDLGPEYSPLSGSPLA